MLSQTAVKNITFPQSTSEILSSLEEQIEAINFSSKNELFLELEQQLHKHFAQAE